MTALKKEKGHTLDIGPLGEGNSLHRHLGMARIVKGFHSFTCTPTRLSTNEVIAFALPAKSGPHLSNPEGWKAELA